MIKVYTAGTWDLFHIGHLNILKHSKALGTHLVVGVSTDELVYSYKGHYPIIPFKDRIEIVAACRYVDEAVPQTGFLDPQDLGQISPDVFALGSDWKDVHIEGIEYMKKNGVEIVFFDYTDGISSTWIREQLNKA